MKQTLTFLSLTIALLGVFKGTALAQAPCPQSFMSAEWKQCHNEWVRTCVNVGYSPEYRAQCRAAIYKKYSRRLQQQRSTQNKNSTQSKYEYVQRVVDGDTIEMANGVKIRLIGVDTPETKHPQKPVEFFGQEATAFTRRMTVSRI